MERARRDGWEEPEEDEQEPDEQVVDMENDDADMLDMMLSISVGYGALPKLSDGLISSKETLKRGLYVCVLFNIGWDVGK